jgi:hypothetical protein
MNLAGESGLALPIVLGVLALGALVTAPFLTHASTNLLGSAAYKQTINETYAADAGVEHAIWSLTGGALASQIPAVGDSTSYVLSYQVNALAVNITVTNTAGGSGGGVSAGTIAQSIISSLQFDFSGYDPVILNIASGIYAVVYTDSYNSVVVKTLGISAAGIISQSIIDSLSIDNPGYEPELINIATGIYAVVYRGSNNKGYIATLQIASNGAIGNYLIDQVVFTSSNSYEPRLIHTSGSYYLVAYRGSSNKGYASTLQISSGGVITNTVVSTYNFAATCYEPDVTPVGGNYYAVAYRGASNKGNLVTLAVNGSGIITGSLIDSLLFNNTAAYIPKILNISGSTYAVAYRGASNYGYITTQTISTAGIISGTTIATFKFEGSACYEPYLIPVSGSVYAVAYRGPSNDGYLKTLDIASSGTINQVVDTFVFDASTGYEPCIIPVSDSVYAVAYRGGKANTGYVKTIGISTSSANTYRILSAAGGTTTTADITIDNGTITPDSWLIER